MKENIKNISDKIQLKEKFGYFKKLLWVFLGIILLCNIALFYFVNGLIYFIALIIGNVILVWILIPVFMWIGKTYLVEAGLKIVDSAKAELQDISKEKIIQVVKQDQK